MIPIVIDSSDLAGEFNLSKQQSEDLLDYVVKGVTAEVARNWQSVAKRELGSTRDEYMRSLIVSDEGPGTGVITLKGQLPNMLEQGSGPFDIKQGFEHSAKKHLKKSGQGWYITIPFRHATPGSLGERSDFSSIMPEEVYVVAKKLQGTKTDIGGITSQGTSLKDIMIPKELANPKVRPEIKVTNKTFEAYRHKSSIYAGMLRMEKFYGSALQSSYITFRRVSDLSDPDSWIHKGLVARNFADKAIAETRMDFITDRAIDEYLQKIGF